MGTMVLIHNRCVFANKQQIKMQETPDAIPEGETPHTVSMCVFDSLVDEVGVAQVENRIGSTRGFQRHLVSSGLNTSKRVKTLYTQIVRPLRRGQAGRQG